MSGHNKWSTIRHKKARTDAKRSKAWTKVVREIIIAARDGGANPEFNSALRLGIQKAKAVNMPRDNIQRAIKRGAGDMDGVDYVALTYEGYGPGGVAIMVECLTDNKNRTVAEVRNIFSKNNGALGTNGSVSWQFERQGSVTINGGGKDEDEVMMEALEAGAEDVEAVEELFVVTTQPTDLAKVAGTLEDAGYAIENAELQWAPQNTVEVTEKIAIQNIRIWQSLEDNDDVQNVYLNAEISDEILAAHMG